MFYCLFVWCLDYLEYCQCHDGQDDDGDELPEDQVGVHLEPAVVEAAVVLVLEAHAEQDHDEGPSPSESSVLKRITF